MGSTGRPAGVSVFYIIDFSKLFILGWSGYAYAVALNGTSLRYFKSHEEYPNNPLDGIKVYGSKIHAYKKPVKVSEDVDECTGFSLLESDGERVVDLALQSQKLCEDWINALCRKGAKVIDDNTIVESLSLLSHS
eukprot:gb/GECG01003272.1/.p1 GENE.gb/GECG01003272.1/~~gb/GECG01003272.1/.p1  ORF type:complete len:135 (+),score=14.73 gb/GECG01003272.1/:1-405(+)